VAERTLQKHFRTFFDLSPQEYLRRTRLAVAREELLDATERVTVTEVAIRSGFNHFGRFSVEYRECFGESPSATLRRRRANLSQPIREPEKQPDAAAVSRRLHLAREKPSIVVLPFHAQPGELGFLAEAFAEGISCALSQLHSLSTRIARPSPGGAPSDPQKVAGRHGARYCITGRTIASAGRLRVLVQLLDTMTQGHLWGDGFDGDLADPLGLQNRLTAGVARAILPSIRNAEIEDARRKGPSDCGSYELAMRALPLAFTANASAARQALDLLEHAMKLDPDDALPVALAAWCHAQLITYNGTASVAEEKARTLRLADRAGILDLDGSPLVLTARCAVHTMMNDLEAGAALLERALALDPTSAWAWERSAWLKTYLGQPKLAIRHFERAIRLAPAHAPNAHRFIGIGSAYFDSGSYEEAVRWKRRAVLEQPGTVWVNRTLAVSYARLCERRAATDALEELRRSFPDLTISQVVNAVPFPRNFLDRVAEGLNDLGLPL
jgi:adenylate cyclase